MLLFSRLTALAALLLIIPSVAAQTTLEIVPATTQITGTGMTFSVDVRFMDYNDVLGFSLPIYYNPAVIQHTSVTNRGQVLAGNGDTPFCQVTTSTSQGEILIDCAILGTQGVSGSNGLAATITFESVGHGTTDLLFDPTSHTNQGAGGTAFLRVRDSNNQTINVTPVTGVVAVKSPLPDVTETKDYDDGDEDGAFPAPNATKARLRVVDALGPGNKTTMALYEGPPPGNDLSPFTDPDNDIQDLEVLDRYWEFATSLSGNFITHLAFSYEGLKSNGAISGIPVPSELRVCMRSLGAEGFNTWQVIPKAETTIDEVEQEVILDTPPAAGNYGPGQYALCADGNDVLPVELVAFEVLLDGKDALLQWKTASETNNAGFEVQHFSDEYAAWQALDFVDGQGTTEQAQAYSYHVEALYAGKHRFRLKQIDYDGTTEYSPEVEVNVSASEAFFLSQPYPNPFGPYQGTTQTQVSLQVSRGQHVVVEVYDVQGRQVARLFDGFLASNQARALVFDAATLQSGLYFIRCRGEYFLTSRPVMLVQ